MKKIINNNLSLVFKVSVKSLQDQCDLGKIKHGHWSIAYKIYGAKSLSSLKELKQKLQITNALLPTISWPAFLIPRSEEIQPIPYNSDSLECWLGKNSSSPDDSDYWVYTKDGKAFIKSGFREDGKDFREYGKCFILHIPIVKLANCLLHAQKMAKYFYSEDTKIEFKITWEDLTQRPLIYFDNVYHHFKPIEGAVCHSNRFSKDFVVTVSDIDKILPEIIYEQLSPLYENFSLYHLQKDFVIDEVASMRKGVR